MKQSRLNSPPVEALEAELTAENEQQHDPESNPDSLDSIVRLLAQAEARYEAAQDDDTWLKHWLIWMELDRLYWQKRGQVGEVT